MHLHVLTHTPVHVCTYPSTCVYIPQYMCVHTPVHVCTCPSTCPSTCVHVLHIRTYTVHALYMSHAQYTCTCLSTCMYVHVHVHVPVHACTCTCTCLSTCMYMYMYMCVRHACGELAVFVTPKLMSTHCSTNTTITFTKPTPHPINHTPYPITSHHHGNSCNHTVM